jgi:hypothetical protein
VLIVFCCNKKVTKNRFNYLEEGVLMTEFRTAHTCNLDYPETGISEILEQLDPSTFLKNSAAIIVGNKDFFETEMVSDLCDALKIPTIGHTTLGSFSTGAPTDKQYILNVSVITSDELDFKTARTKGDFNSAPKRRIQTMVAELTAKCGGKEPANIFIAENIQDEVGNDGLTKFVSDEFKETNIFGAVAIHLDETVSSSRITSVVCDGEVFESGMAVLGIVGDFNCEYFYYALENHDAFNCEAVVTEADEVILKTINYKPALTFFKDLGVITDENIDYAFTLPLMIDSRDGVDPIARTVASFTPEGYAIITAAIPVGSMLSIATISDKYVINTMKKACEHINEIKPKAVFFVSCAVRNLTLGIDVFAEIEKLKETLDPSIPVIFSYAGGEICPVSKSEQKKYVNRTHNNTLTMCLVK